MKRKLSTLFARQRHPLPRRIKWWLRDKWRWFRKLAWWQKSLLVGGPLVLVVLVIPLLTFAYFALTMGDMEYLMNRNNTGVVLKDIDGQVFYSTGTAEHRELVSLDQMSPHIKEALIASEDRNFYQHGGVSILSTLRAIYGYVFSGGGEFGGSTLTQQRAKMTLLSTDRGFLRQYQAFSVALAIEQRYSKDEILEMYLNAAYFGNNSFGIEKAARNYFNVTPAELTVAQSAMLVGLLPAPSYYSPIMGDAALGVRQQGEVLRRMVRAEFITEAERTAALEVELVYQPPAIIKNDAPHFTEMVLAELYDKYGEETVERAGYQVTTTLNLALQRKALEGVEQQIGYIQAMGGSNAGLIAIDPRSGEIRALVGSVDYQDETWGKVNMATTKRQPGSTFKALYYAAALADGVTTPSTVIRDEPINIGGYSPQNATRRYYGDVTVRQALARSLNIPAVKLMQQYGIANSIDAAKKLGVTTLDKSPGDYGLALAIGAAEVPLDQMTNAYAAFAAGGQIYGTTTVHAINDKHDTVIYERKAEATQAISSQGAYLISSILSDAQARSFMFGTSLNVAGKTVAVKTGTTDDNRDAWAIGYTPDIAVGVWVGNNDNTVMKSGGADMAGPIWRYTMQAAIGEGTSEFVAPSGVVQRYVCYGSGGLATQAGTNTYSEWFLATALPTSSCSATTRTEEQKPPEPEPEPTPPVTEDEEEEEPEEETPTPTPEVPTPPTPTVPVTPTP